MAFANNLPEDNQLVKELIIGHSKAGKTHYTCAAALAGFNVLYIEGDVSRPTISQFPKEALERIFYLPFGDQVSRGGQYTPRFALLLRKFLKEGTFWWNETKCRTVIPAQDQGHDVWEIDSSKLDSNWVLVVDSWTAITHSIMTVISMNAGVDLAEMDKAGMAIYGGASNFATDILSRLRNLPCHVIVVAHPDEYVKYKVKTGGVRENQRTENREVESVYMVPKSTSRPHAMTLPTYFTDVGWLGVSPMGDRSIDFSPCHDRSTGGRFTTKLSVENGSFARIVAQAGGREPESRSSDPALLHHPDYQPPEGVISSNTMMNAPSGSAGGSVQLGVQAPAKLRLGKT